MQVRIVKEVFGAVDHHVAQSSGVPSIPTTVAESDKRWHERKIDGVVGLKTKPCKDVIILPNNPKKNGKLPKRLCFYSNYIENSELSF